jgi:hypothetical protein
VWEIGVTSGALSAKKTVTVVANGVAQADLQL